jgi:hypothetical protein
MLDGCHVSVYLTFMFSSLSESAATSATPENANVWGALPSILWVGLVIIGFVLLRKQLVNLLENLAWRVRTGASIKLFSLELGQTYIAPNVGKSDESVLPHRTDSDSRRWKQREAYYVPNRKIFLVHRLAPSKHKGMLYDIEIYLAPHKEATLASVARVDYYFGRNWGNQIFSSTDRARSFAISTSAYGPFMCTAELLFTDGESVIIGRYVDFEMGAIGTRME